MTILKIYIRIVQNNWADVDRYWYHRDAWIGLYQNSDLCECSSVVSCDSCLATWSWIEGSPMRWWVWSSHEPDAIGRCGRLNYQSWAEGECDTKLPYICEKGKVKRRLDRGVGKKADRQESRQAGTRQAGGLAGRDG